MKKYLEKTRKIVEGLETTIKNKPYTAAATVIATMIFTVLLVTIKFWLPPLLLLAVIVWVLTDNKNNNQNLEVEPPTLAVYSQMLVVLNKLSKQLAIAHIHDENDLLIKPPVANINCIPIIRCRVLKQTQAPLTLEELTAAKTLVQNALYQQAMPIYVLEITDTGLYIIFSVVYADTAQKQQYCENYIARSNATNPVMDLYEEL